MGHEIGVLATADFIVVAFKTVSMLQSASRLLPTPSRTAMAISNLANLDSSFTYRVAQSGCSDIIYTLQVDVLV